MPWRITLLLIACAALAGCDDTTPDGDPLVLAVDQGSDGGLPSGDAAPDATPDAAPDAALSDDPCDRVAPAVPDGRPAPVQWSAAHALARFFGAHAGSAAVDTALVAAFEDGAEGDPAVYAEALPFVCAIDGDGPGLGSASVALRDGVAYVRPGTGPIAVPLEAESIVLELADLPADPALPEALAAAMDVCLDAPLTLSLRVRVVEGLPDEVYTPANLYTTQVAATEVTWPGTARLPLPIAVRVGPRMAPAAARLAGALRVARRASLVGHDVFAATAESEALPLSEGGLAVRWATALDPAGAPWPDVIPADAPSVDDWLDDMPDAMPDAMPPVAGPAGRPGMTPFVPYDQAPPGAESAATRRAMLLVVHGALRRFFPYFDVVGDGIDERLMETWATLDDDEGWDRADTVALLRRFAEVIHDGHAFVFDGLQRGGVAPIAVDHLADEAPVVRASNDFAVRAGHVITHIDGIPAAEWYADELTRTSAATRGYALDLASRRYLQGVDPLRLGLRDLDGATFEATLDRVAAGQAPSFTAWRRPTGWLDVEGAPGLFYVNLANDVEDDIADLMARVDAALPDALGIVIDMRGYPGLPTDRVAITAIGGEVWRSPMFEVPRWRGPEAREVSASQYDALAVGGRQARAVPPFAGPVVLLVGPTSVSAAENFAMSIARSDAVTVVGRRSAGTNGNITGVRLPGALGFTFTGMRVLFPDGAAFHGIGIEPDVEVSPTAAALAAGRDEALEAAIRAAR